MTASTLINFVLAPISIVWVVCALSIWWASKTPPRLQDKPTLGMLRAEWAPLILNQYGTLRRVKMFANRLRVLVARLDRAESQIDDDRLRIMVGFAALYELGETGRNLAFQGTEEFNEWLSRWKNKVGDLYPNDASERKPGESIDVFFSKAELQHWEDFATLGEWIVFPGTNEARAGGRRSGNGGR